MQWILPGTCFTKSCSFSLQYSLSNNAIVLWIVSELSTTLIGYWTCFTSTENHRLKLSGIRNLHWMDVSHRSKYRISKPKSTRFFASIDRWVLCILSQKAILVSCLSQQHISVKWKSLRTEPPTGIQKAFKFRNRHSPWIISDWIRSLKTARNNTRTNFTFNAFTQLFDELKIKNLL